jgi:hypothetical protein
MKGDVKGKERMLPYEIVKAFGYGALVNNLKVKLDESINNFKLLKSELDYKHNINVLLTKYENHIKRIYDADREIFDEIFMKMRSDTYTTPLKFIENYGQRLYDLFPITIGMPDDIATSFDLRKDLFDMTIIDEASQM